ncbi:MAG TPA: hypothetical protein VGC36_15840 [Rhizomicrobium sp.]
MRPAHILLFAAMGTTLAACGSGVSTPSELRGVWSDACPTGMIEVGEDTLHILYPNRQDFQITESTFDGKTWKFSFDNNGKKITDVYVYENNTLRAEQVILDSGTFNSNKIRMTKCG